MDSPPSDFQDRSNVGFEGVPDHCERLRLHAATAAKIPVGLRILMGHDDGLVKKRRQAAPADLSGLFLEISFCIKDCVIMAPESFQRLDDTRERGSRHVDDGPPGPQDAVYLFPICSESDRRFNHGDRERFPAEAKFFHITEFRPGQRIKKLLFPGIGGECLFEDIDSLIEPNLAIPKGIVSINGNKAETVSVHKKRFLPAKLHINWRFFGIFVG